MDDQPQEHVSVHLLRLVDQCYYAKRSPWIIMVNCVPYSTMILTALTTKHFQSLDYHDYSMLFQHNYCGHSSHV